MRNMFYIVEDLLQWLHNFFLRYIKMSSPHVNNIIIFGGLLCYVKVFLDTIDSRFVSLETYGRFCNVS